MSRTVPAASSSALLHPYAGIFPVMSYLHVPSKMSKPLWLMMGSCFLLDVERLLLTTTSSSSSSTTSTSSSSSSPSAYWWSKSPFVMLTSAHTFLPWSWMPDSSALKIPEEYRRARYVTGRLMLSDASGRAIGSHTFTVTPNRFHPTLDICALTMSGVDSDAFRRAIKEGHQERYFRLATTEAAVGSSIVVSGYRGIGRLGELDTLDAATLSKLTKEEQATLMQELQSVEGKQEGNACGLQVARRGVAITTHGRCYNGMSGAPALATVFEGGNNKITASSSSSPVAHDSQECCGALYGYVHQNKAAGSFPADEQGWIGYIPSTAIVDWLLQH